MNDRVTLYKLMILYLLKQVNLPLSDSQLLDFFSREGCEEEPLFRDTLDALLEANLVVRDEVRNIARYELTREGEDALYYFRNEIPEETLQDMDAYLKKNRFQLRNETGITADYYKNENHEYTVHMMVREGKNILFELKLSVPSEDQAVVACRYFKENAQKVYAGVLKQLM